MFALRILLIGCVICGLFAPPLRAGAGEWPELATFFAGHVPMNQRLEFASGFDASGNGWSAYSTAVIGLGGPLNRDGLRLKLSGIFSSYSYDTRVSTICKKIHDVGQTDPNRTLDAICDSIANNEAPDISASTRDFLAANGLKIEGDQLVAELRHRAARTELAIAPGYQTTWGPLIVKAYVGFGFERQVITPADTENALAGSFWGSKGWLEAWLPLGEQFWLSADGGYFTGTSRYSAAMKFGYAPAGWLAFGPELAAFGDEQDASARAGGFLRFNAAGLETTLAGGISGAYKSEPGAYGSAGMFMKF